MYQKILAQFNTNVFGTMGLTRSFLPSFRARGSGTITMISSVDAWVRRPGFGAYTASKYGLEGLTDCLRLELTPSGIKTLTIEPGTFRTSALTPNTLHVKPSSLDAYTELHESLTSIFDIHGSEPGDPDKLVERVIDIIRSEGVAKDKIFPDRLPFGQDALDEIREECRETMKRLDEWESVICSTDCDTT